MTPAQEAQLRVKLAERFGYTIDERRIRFVQSRYGFLVGKIAKMANFSWRTLLEARHYPRFTLFFQQYFGGLIFSLACLFSLNPTLLIESTGIPAALPVFRWLGGARVLVYMHYPTITTSAAKQKLNHARRHLQT